MFDLRHRLRAPASRALMALALAVASCGGDDLAGGSHGDPFDGGELGTAGDGGVTDPGCPESPPKIGSVCPAFFDSQATCTFVTGTCEDNGQSYDVEQDYCCFGGYWNTCGTNNTPCDQRPPGDDEPPPIRPDARPVDARSAADAPVPSVDAGAPEAPPADAADEVGPDSGPDGGVEDAVADAAPAADA